MMSDNLDGITDWSHVAGEELALALTSAGIRVLDCYGDEGGVHISFPHIHSAEALMTMAVPVSPEPGDLYDRSTGSCVTLRALAEQYGDDVPESVLEGAFKAGWEWIVHPHMSGRVMGWHVSVSMPGADANQITATLNSLRHGGAL